MKPISALTKAKAALVGEMQKMIGKVAAAKSATALNELTFKLVSKRTDALIEKALQEEND